jgi:hypothetical protein
VATLTLAERWLPVDSWERFYSVSDLGRVRSHDRIVPRRGSPYRLSGRIRSTPISKSGYKMVTLHAEGREQTAYVHRLVLIAFTGPCPGGKESCHGPGGSLDNRWVNLRWDTPSANNFDSVRDGTHGMASKATCKRRHLLIQPNLCPGDLARGWRRCKACHYARGHIDRSGFGVMDLISDAYYQQIMGVSA